MDMCIFLFNDNLDSMLFKLKQMNSTIFLALDAWDAVCSEGFKPSLYLKPKPGSVKRFQYVFVYSQLSVSAVEDLNKSTVVNIQWQMGL